MSIDLALSIEADGWSAVPDPEGLIQTALDEAERQSGLRLADGAEVSVMLCDDAAIRELNATWRGKDKATNVLSFPAALPGALHERPMLGDIAIAWETTASEAAAEGKALRDHLTHLAVHGFLHLIGFDHEDEAEANTMETLETRILAGLGVADPYDHHYLETSSP